MRRLLMIILLLTSNLIFVMQSFAHNLDGKFSLPEDLSDNFAKKSLGNFIIPNEFSPDSQFEALKYANGLMLSVGTFRTLIIYAWADNVTHLLAADYDLPTVKFNRAHLDIILSLSEQFPDPFLQRFHYICFLHGRKFTGDLMPEEMSAKNVVQLVRNMIIGNDGRLSKNYGHNGDRVSRLGREFFKIQFENETWIGNPMSQTLFKYKNPPEITGGYYWDNNIQWQKIVDGIKERRIAVVTVDLTDGDQTMALTKFIESTGLNFGLRDRSNIPFVHPNLSIADVELYSEQAHCKFQNLWHINNPKFLANL